MLKAQSPDTRTLSPKEFAQRHGVTTRTVRRWIATGRIRVIRITQRTIRIVPTTKLRTVADTHRSESTLSPQNP